MKSILFIHPVGTKVGEYNFLKNENFNIFSAEMPFEYLKNIDSVIHNWLFDEFEMLNEAMNFDLIMLSIAPTESILAYDGIRLALHLRLSQKLSEEVRTLPILLLGNESKEHLLQLNPSNVFLFTKGIEYVPFLQSEIQPYLLGNKAIARPNLTYINSKLKSYIQLEKPENYSSHHSLANEWGVLRLAQLLEKDNLLNNNEHISNLKAQLLFKQLDNKSDLKPIVAEKVNLKNAKGKTILLIDDEWEKGWLAILKSYFKDQEATLTHLPIEKGDDLDIIKTKLETKLKETDYDLFLTDLRLSDTDFEDDTKIEQLGGIQLLEQIKDHNQGNQVIFLTASNKIWNAKEVLRLGASGYFLKESPQNAFTQAEAEENLTKFCKQVEECFSNGEYLKRILVSNQNIIGKLKNNANSKWKEKEMLSKIEQIHLPNAFDNATLNTVENNKYLIYAFLEYFKIIELLCDTYYQFNFDKKENYVVNIENEKIIVVEKKPLKSKIKPIINGKNKVASYINCDYLVEDNNKKQYLYPGTSFKFCALLLLKWQQETTATQMFFYFNDLRNQLIAHQKVKTNTEILNFEHLASLAEFIDSVLKV